MKGKVEKKSAGENKAKPEGKLVRTVKFPPQITAELKGADVVLLKGPKGSAQKEFKTYRIKLSASGNKVVVEGSPNNKKTTKIMESIISHLSNMAEGLLYGYKYQLRAVYSHFPMSLQVEKDAVNIKNFLGEKFPRKSKIIGATKVEVKGQEITVSGTDKEAVGQTASNLELRTKVRGKDIRRFQDGIYLIETGNVDEKKVLPAEVIRGAE